MQYPNTAYRNSNGLFVQGRLRPAVMAVINIVLSVSLAFVFYPYGKQWGVFGILIATPISRLLTETWFDPRVVYKHVFKTSMNKYFVTQSFNVEFPVIGYYIGLYLTHLSVENGVNFEQFISMTRNEIINIVL